MNQQQPSLTILIATLGQRQERFLKLLNVLTPQIKKYEGKIKILAYWNNFEHPIGVIRQRLLEAADTDYISFVDDDDLVPEYYCDEIYKRLGKADYIGWQMQLYHNGQKMKPTFHSIKYTGWWDDENGYYRNISHLNPIKRSIALKGSFIVEEGAAEDASWAQQVAPFVKTEEYIDKVMYFYHHSTEDSLWRGGRADKEYKRPIIRRPYFKYYEAK